MHAFRTSDSQTRMLISVHRMMTADTPAAPSAHASPTFGGDPSLQSSSVPSTATAAVPHCVKDMCLPRKLCRWMAPSPKSKDVFGVPDQ